LVHSDLNEKFDPCEVEILIEELKGHTSSGISGINGSDRR
jgi:hypothetical protein